MVPLDKVIHIYHHIVIDQSVFDLFDRWCQPKRHAITGAFFFGPLIGEKMSKGILSADDNGITASVIFRDKKGNISSPFGVPEWSLAADGVVAMTVAPDGMTATFVPVAVGATVINVLAEGEATPGEQPIALSGELEVVASDAETGEIVFGPVT
jgi:hypothetical protein